MPGLTDYGFSQHNRKPEWDIDAQMIDMDSQVPAWGIDDFQIDDLSVNKLKTGTISSRQITLSVTPTEGDVYIASGKTDFDNSATGFILGVDDSDSDLPKFYIGTTTQYLNFTGSQVNIAGTLTASEIHIPDEDTTANSFHVESDGDSFWGCTQSDFTSDNDNASAYVLKTGVAKFQSVTLTGSVVLDSLGAGSDLDGQYLTDVTVSNIKRTMLQEVNLLLNKYSDFEQIVDGTTLPGDGSTRDITTSAYYFGTRCLNLITSNGSDSAYLASSTSDYNIPLLSSTKYIVSFYAKGASGGEQVRAVILQDDTGSKVGDDKTITTSWVRYYSAISTDGSVTDSGLVFLQGRSNGTIYLDGIQVELASTASSPEPSAYKPGALSSLLVDHLVANSSYAGEFVANTANIKDAIITDAKIDTLGVNKLTAGTITSKAITLAVSAGTGDVKIQGGKTDFGDTTAGFILGLDDSDSDNPKFEMGDATDSVNMDNGSITITGTINANAGDFTGSLNLGDGSTASGTITMNIANGQGDCYIAAGKSDFTNAAAGFILGQDDSDSDKAKLYVGDSSSYLNWDGSSLTIAGTLTIGSIPNLPGDENLVAYFPFEGAAIDNSRSPLTITTANDTYVAGQSGQALSANGSTTAIYATDATKIQNIFDSGGSISAWIYVDSDGENDFGRIADKDLAGSDGWAFYVSDESGGEVKLKFYQRFSSNEGTWQTTSTEIATGEWTHVVVTYNNDSTSNNALLYVNSVSVTVTETTVPDGTRSDDTGNDLYVSNRSGSDRTFDGEMDELRFYNDILTANEVKALYLYPSGTKPDTFLQHWGHSSDVTQIDGGNIYANTVTATQIAATTITTTELNFTPVQDTDVIAKINASAEGITIDADNISITGATTFTAGWAAATNAEDDIDALNTTNGPAEASADVTSANTANDTTNVNSLASTTLIVGGKIGTNLVEAAAINVTDLAAINADLGTVTAGSITTASITIADAVIFGSTATGTVELRANTLFERYIAVGSKDDGATETIGGGCTLTRDLLQTRLNSATGNTVRLTTDTFGPINSTPNWSNDFEVIMFANTETNVTQDIFLGAMDNTVTNVPADATSTAPHIGFFVHDEKLYASNANNTTQTKTEITGITFTNWNYYRFEFDSGTNIKFYVNDTLEATHTTNLPTGSYTNQSPMLYMGIECQSGAADQSMLVSNNYSVLVTV